VVSLPPSSFAWEPLTPRGVAAFAHATAGRLLVLQFFIALIVAASVTWFLYDSWCPTVRAAIEQLPDEGEIRFGKLDWRGSTPQLLAEGTFLALSVDPEHGSDLRSPAHVQVEFGKEMVFIHSLLGYAETRYPTKWIIAFNRNELKPWWGAWQPALLAGAAVTVIVGLLVLWHVLATIYALPVWLIVFFTNRDLKLPECCRLAGAALMPGALLMVAGILLYDFGVLDLAGLVFVTGGHLVLGWIYLLVSPLFLPKSPVASSTRKNPFVAPRPEDRKSNVGGQQGDS
jgi:hypothetical protein